MEVVEAVISSISSVGFPIVMCILLFNQNNKITETITNNTIAINKLVEELKDRK